MSDLDETDKQTIRERDSKRLQVMEKYCYTTECLRNYILKYFGENPDKPCGDCGNCLHEFETLDMTDEAKKIINCVYEANGRYGRNIIIDTVSGAKTARLEEIGAAKYKSYGVLASSNKNLLRRLVEQLVLEGYLTVGDYQVLKMGDISRLRNPDTHVLVKITDDDKLPERTAASNKKAKATDVLTSAGYELFDRLRVGQSYDERMHAKLYAREKGMYIEEGLLAGVGESDEDIADSLMIMGEIGARQVRVMSFVPQEGSPMENHAEPDRLKELVIIALMRHLYPNALIPASLDVDGISGLKDRINAGANLITSIIPPRSGFMGVAHNTMDVDEGGRTVEEAASILNGMGLRIATTDGPCQQRSELHGGTGFYC